MKMKKMRRTAAVSLSQSRWVAYASAGAATALATAASMEAEIHYSGPIGRHFDAPPGGTELGLFPLDKRGDYFALQHLRDRSPDQPLWGGAVFAIAGIVSAGFAGFNGTFNGEVYGYPYKLNAGQNISNLPFVTTASLPGYLASTYGFGNANSQWLESGRGYIGFRFNNGAGPQYGWARVKMDGAPGNRFIFLDYAWGDVGDRVKAGQKKCQAPGAIVPTSGSLGFLALGSAGLMAWRKRRTPQMV